MEGNNLLLSILMFILGLIIGIGAIILIKYLKEKKDKKVADSIIIAAKNEAEKLQKKAEEAAKEKAEQIKERQKKKKKKDAENKQKEASII